MEHWILMKEYTGTQINNNSLHLPGDKIYISDKGNVKYNDIELTFEFGLYICGGEIGICGTNFIHKSIYRTIYTLFNKPIKQGNIIHHIDGNHYNNDIDNLYECTPQEHTKIHSIEGYTDTSLYIETLKETSDSSYTSFKNYLKDRVCKYIEEQKNIQRVNAEIREREKEQLRIDREIRKQREIQDKIASGKYKYDTRGVLRPTTTAKKGWKTPEYVKEKQSIAIKSKWQNDSEYAEKCRKANREKWKMKQN